MLDYLLDQPSGFETTIKALAERLPEYKNRIGHLLFSLARLKFLKTRIAKTKNFKVTHFSVEGWITSRGKISDFRQELRKLIILKSKSIAISRIKAVNAQSEISVLQTQFPIARRAAD